ncbi:TetR/AcrR family transcriptional regulator [Nonomuraea sp. NPDC046570]|uniref:TetR/AcrR family transcriptional regulator n=1 Tax=Nonomuraea sp. NPDC046570 TaxID=3155255 RepID=UPI0033C98105
MKPAVRKPYAVGVARRQQILDAAHELFSLRGYRGASMRDVAAQVGLSMAGLLHYFPSKEDLLEAVLQHRDDTDIPWFEEKWAEIGSFREAMRELAVRNMAQPEIVRLFVTLSAEATDPAHPAHDYFQERYRTSRELFTRTVATARERGELTAEADGPLLIAVLDGLQIQWLLEPGFDLLGRLDRHLDTITPRRSGAP